MNDIITYIRRIIKTPSNAQITDNLIVDYINRFWIMDVDARIQLFDLKTTYQFQTTPGIDQYNMPLYNIQGSNLQENIGQYPVYQGFFSPCFVDGIQIPYYTERNQFNNIWPNYLLEKKFIGIGNGTVGPYTFPLPFIPKFPIPIVNEQFSGILRGHVDIQGIMAVLNAGGNNVDPPLVESATALIPDPQNYLSVIPTTSIFPQVYFTSTDETGKNIVISDTGIFLEDNMYCGLLMNPGSAPYGNTALFNPLDTTTYTDTQNTINYVTGIANNIYFPEAIPAGVPINVQAAFYQFGLPRAILYYNNVLILRSPPDTQYLITIDAYLTPAAFLNSGQAIQFAYMSEYIARGAARKILSDLGDKEQFGFYEQFFREQELLVWKRSQRQFTSTRVQTIYSGGGFGSSWGVGSGTGVT